MVFLITSENVLNGCINHIDIGTETVVEIIDCTDLVELPCWPNIQRVYCRNCTGLMTLPCWPNVTFIECRNCPRLFLTNNWLQSVDIYYSNYPNIQEKSVFMVLQTDYLQSAFVPEFINL